MTLGPSPWTAAPLPCSPSRDLLALRWACAWLAGVAPRSHQRGRSPAQIFSFLIILLVLLQRLSSTVECESLFCFLYHFLQAKLGIRQIRVGLRPGNLVAQVSHYEMGSPVGWSPGLDTEPGIIIIKTPLLYDICFQHSRLISPYTCLQRFLQAWRVFVLVGNWENS